MVIAQTESKVTLKRRTSQKRTICMQARISLGEGRSLLASFSIMPNSRDWVVFIPESGAEYQDGDGFEIESLIGKKAAREFNFLVINKPGVEPKGIKAKAFENSFRRQYRVRDNLKVMHEVIPDNHRITLVGYSEGAYLAPQVALQDSRVQKIVMIGGGTRGWLKEEISNAGRLEKPALKKKIKEILAHPSSTKKWNGFSYATWVSYKDDNTLNALKKVKLPMLAVLGGRDRTIDFKTTLKDLKQLSRSKKLRIHVFENCGHSFVNYWADAWNEVRKFIIK